MCPALTAMMFFYFSESIGTFRTTELNFGITEDQTFSLFCFNYHTYLVSIFFTFFYLIAPQNNPPNMLQRHT